jgi:hypothetical protein
LSADGTEVSFKIGGTRGYAAVHMFEDRLLPEELWQYFSPEFRKRLEFRRNSVKWQPIADAETTWLESKVAEGKASAQVLGQREKN